MLGKRSIRNEPRNQIAHINAISIDSREMLQIAGCSLVNENQIRFLRIFDGEFCDRLSIYLNVVFQNQTKFGLACGNFPPAFRMRKVTTECAWFEFRFIVPETTGEMPISRKREIRVMAVMSGNQGWLQR